MPAVPQSVTQARHAVIELSLPSASIREDMALAVSEAVGNAVVHAFRDGREGTVRLRVTSDGGRLHVIVSDNGTGMQPSLERKGLGVGMGIMRHVTDDLHLETSDTGTTVWMTFQEAA